MSSKNCFIVTLIYKDAKNDNRKNCMKIKQLIIKLHYADFRLSHSLNPWHRFKSDKLHNKIVQQIPSMITSLVHTRHTTV